MKARGENHHNAKLTMDQVREIRRRFVPSIRTEGNCAELAAEYSLSKEAIRKIASGKRWGWMDADQASTLDVWRQNDDLAKFDDALADLRSMVDRG